MNSNLIEQRKLLKNSTQALVITTIIGMLVTLIVDYFAGDRFGFLGYRLMSWPYSLGIALPINILCYIISPYFKHKILFYLPYLFMITPISRILDFVYMDSGAGNYMRINNFLFWLGFVAPILVTVFILFIFNRKKVYSRLYIPDENNNLVDSELNRESSVLTNVISSILIRARASNKVIVFSLITMVAIVIIGGWASFGTVALNEAKKIRELEVERVKMLDVVKAINLTDYNERNMRIQDIITRLYGNETEYKDIIENMEKQSYISWPDIAMRITIAALTLFLVQIFFHIYKYNQQKASHLFAKAETLELYREQGADQSELRAGLLAKMDANPKFEKTPLTPVEQVINASNKRKGE